MSAAAPYLRAAGRALAHPRWFAVTIRRQADRRSDRGRPFSLSEQDEHLTTPVRALAAAAGIAEADYRGCAASLWTPERDPDSELPVLAPRDALTELLGVLVRLTRPGVVVETGVGAGHTSAVILDALRRNGHGRLYSVEMPPLRAARGFVGGVVPAGHRDRWTLELGPSSHVLPRLAERVGPIDVFLHDADHTYRSQLTEYRTVWPHLRSGGVLVSDDVANPAFVEFAAEHGVVPHLVAEPGDASAVGVLAKP